VITPNSYKLLSFCIPTYGQSERMRQTLESLLIQDLDGVEIVIRDDNKNDETEKIVSQYMNRLPIRYYRMEKQGIDIAFLFLSKEARGNFVWWFGDDFLVEGSISRVTTFLKSNPDVDLMYINSTDMTGENYSIQPNGSHYFVDHNEALDKLKDQLGFCSAILFKKTILSLGFEKAEKFIGTAWVTLFLVIHALTSGKHFYFLDGNNFKSESKPMGESRWYDSFLVHGIYFAIVVRYFENRFNRKTLNELLVYKFSRSWRAVVVERAHGFKTGFAAAKLHLPKLMRLYWSNPELYIAIPLMLLPQPILTVLYSTYKKFRLLRL
jgi:abequosyltransferase